MFLGLDRRARFEEDITKTSRLLTPRSIRSSRNVFATSLSRSLSDAEELAATNYRDALILSGQIAEELQQELLLSLLSVDMGDGGTLSVPTSRIPSFFLTQIYSDWPEFMSKWPRRDLSGSGGRDAAFWRSY